MTKNGKDKCVICGRKPAFAIFPNEYFCKKCIKLFGFDDLVGKKARKKDNEPLEPQSS